MPWTPEEFSQKHNHKLSGKAARGASEAADKALASDKSDASAIRIGNAVGDKVGGFAHGGSVEHKQLAKQAEARAEHAKGTGQSYAGGGFVNTGVAPQPTMGVSSAYPAPPGKRAEGPRNYGKK
jgi:hypothetical protein